MLTPQDLIFSSTGVMIQAQKVQFSMQIIIGPRALLKSIMEKAQKLLWEYLDYPSHIEISVHEK